MIAVIKTGGKQYIVKVGDVIQVEKIKGEVGETVKISEVLLVGEGEKVEIGEPNLSKVVEAEIVENLKTKKIRVYKMHSKKKYRRTHGHRQQMTKIRITAIKEGKAEKTEERVIQEETKVKKTVAAKK